MFVWETKVAELQEQMKALKKMIAQLGDRLDSINLKTSFDEYDGVYATHLINISNFQARLIYTALQEYRGSSLCHYYEFSGLKEQIRKIVEGCDCK